MQNGNIDTARFGGNVKNEPLLGKVNVGEEMLVSRNRVGATLLSARVQELKHVERSKCAIKIKAPEERTKTSSMVLW